MSDGICSDDERYGGFGASMANSLAAYGAAPARVVAAVTAARAPLPVAATERVWLTKRPYKKRQKKSGMPAPAPQEAAAPAEAPAPAEKKSPPVTEKKSPPVLVAAPTVVAPAPFSFGEPIHPSGIVVEIVGTEMSCQGRSCEEHDICGEVLKEDIVVRLRKGGSAASWVGLDVRCVDES